MASNGTWGEIVEHDSELAQAWDSFQSLPEEGENEALDTFCERKRITIRDLVRVGCRITSDPFVLVFGGPGYIKFRNLVSGQRWNYLGSSFSALKIVHPQPAQSDVCILAEGETDAAWLTGHYDCDIAIMGAGAKTFPQSYADALSTYKLVLVALDNDNAGNKGAQKALDKLHNAVRFPPAENSENDWCGADTVIPLPDPDSIVVSIENKLLVPAGELLAVEPPSTVSWFEQALLPIAGQLILHGWAKSYKSFLTLDILASLSQGEPWCHFEPTEEPCKVAVLQYEIPWPYYQQRLQFLNQHAKNPQLFQANFLTFTPFIRPNFVAGNKAQEDLLLGALAAENVSILLLDPIRRGTGSVDLNSEKDVRPILDFAARVQDEGITVILTHHDNKTYSKQGGGDPLGMTGAGAFAGDADTIISVSVPKGMTLQDATRNLTFTTRNGPAPGMRSMTMTQSGLIIYDREAAWADDAELGSVQPQI